MHSLQTLVKNLGVVTALGSVLFTAPVFSCEGHNKPASSHTQAASGQHSSGGENHSMPKPAGFKKVSQAEADRSRNAERYLNQGLDELHRNDTKKALASFTKALEYAPTHAGVYTYRGDLYYSLGRYQEAIVDYSRAIESNQSFSYLYNRRGDAYQALKDYKAALKDYNQSVELYPEQGATYRNLGSVNYKLNNYPAALKNLNQALQLNPTLADAHQMRGEIYMKQGNRKAAIADFQQANQLFADRGNTADSQKMSNLVQELQKQSTSTLAP